MNWVDNAQKKKYKWPSNIWRNALHPWSQGNTKKLHWDSTSPQSEWLSSITQITNAGENVEEKQLPTMLVGI
jgi:hypothetical protein